MEVGLVAWWLVTFGALSVIGYPIAARVFRRFPGGGVGFAPAISLAVMTYTAYWIGQISFDRWVLWVALTAVCALAAVTAVELSKLRQGTITLVSIPTDRRILAETMTVFLGGFLFVVAIRTADPAIAPLGGEKFLDYSLLRTILRAESLPPQDVWFAGEQVNYYYGGHLMAALLTWLTDTDPAFGYNLALAGTYATLLTAVYSLAGAVGSTLGGSRRSAALFGIVFVGLASNLATGVQIVIGAFPAAVAGPLARVFSRGTAYTTEELVAGIYEFSYWSPSRVLPGTINEFPLFAWLNGDLHAHMMAAPFLLLGVAVAFAYWQTPAEQLRRRRGLIFGVVPLLGGLQIVVHTWDFPTIFGVAWLALAFAPAPPVELLPHGSRLLTRFHAQSDNHPLSEEVVQTGGALTVAVVAAGGATLLGAPFLLQASSGQAIDFLEAVDRSRLPGLLLVHGGFIAAFGLFFGSRLIDNARSGGRLLILGALGFVTVTALVTQFAALALVVPLLVAGWILLRTQEAGFETVLVIAGAGLVGIVELVYVVELAGPGRFNTVFKVYSQVWLLWGIATAVVVSDLWEQPPTVAPLSRVLPNRGTRRSIARGGVALLVISTLLYAPLAAGGHFQTNDAGTLHGTAYVDSRHPADAEAIQWLETHADGTDVLLEAPGASVSPDGTARNPETPGMYTWGANPASSLTGIPTVAGWAHEIGYRGIDPYYERVSAVDRAYAGSDAERVAALSEYGVTLIYVGATERERYGQMRFSRFEGVTLAFENEGVRIYAIDHDRLDS